MRISERRGAIRDDFREFETKDDLIERNQGVMNMWETLSLKDRLTWCRLVTLRESSETFCIIRSSAFDVPEDGRRAQVIVLSAYDPTVSKFWDMRYTNPNHGRCRL